MTKVKLFYYLTVLITLCLSTSKSIAQSYDDEEEDTRTVWAGVVVGSNISQVSGDFLQGFRKYGINAGLTSSIKLAPRLSASLELLYSVKGARASNLELPYPDLKQNFYKSYGITLPYFELPIYLSYYDKKKSNIGVGVSYGRLNNPKEMLDSVNLATKYRFKSSDWNFIINSSLAVYKKKGFLNFRYAFSMNNIREIPNPNLPHFQEQFSKLMAIRAIYLF